MSATASIIDQKSYGMAASDHLAFFDGSELEKDPFTRYKEFEEFATANPDATDFPEEFSPWPEQESFTAQQIRDSIESQAVVLKNTFRDILRLAKEGIVLAEIEDDFPEDMNELDLEQYANRGHEHLVNQSILKELADLKTILRDDRKVLTDAQARRYEELFSIISERGIEIPLNLQAIFKAEL